MAHPTYNLAKRSFDILVSAAGLLLLSPLMLAIAILIKAGSPGPVLYRGIRSGLHGHPFRIYKFRSMVVDAERLGGMSTAKDDPRVTPIGHMLRRYKLDELPQLLNVLKGEMSIVGPRPEMPAYTALYQGEERLILSVRPGITDYASIEFIRLGDLLGNDDPDAVYEREIRPLKNALRLKYVQECSFWSDMALIARTLGRLVGVSRP
jgi:lipopolysaccharide/colanic/teichoic acid biosynthesis glycosyltransferase